MIHTFDKRLENISQALWLKLTQIEEVKGNWHGSARLSPQILTRLKQTVLITSTGASTRIEGSQLSDEDIEKMLKGIVIQKFGTRDSQEVQGYYELLQNIFNSWDSLSFSENLIKHFHKELLKYVDKDALHRGHYKQKEKAYLAPIEMQELVDWTKSALAGKKYHPLLIIGNFIVTFLSIHPFEDGNGRLSRILTNLLLLKQGYSYVPYVSHEKIIEDNKPEYYLSLRKSQKTLKTKSPDISIWEGFFLDVILTQSNLAMELLTKSNSESLLSPQQLLVWNFLTKVAETTPKEIASQTGVPRPTINQVLNKLLDLKMIERLGQGSTTRYRKI